MDMRMKVESLAPGVKDRQESDRRTEMLWIGRDGEQRFRYGAEWYRRKCFAATHLMQPVGPMCPTGREAASIRSLVGDCMAIIAGENPRRRGSASLLKRLLEPSLPCAERDGAHRRRCLSRCRYFGCGMMFTIRYPSFWMRK